MKTIDYLRKDKKLAPNSMDKDRAKSILLQLYRDINDNDKFIIRKNRIYEENINETDNDEYEDILGAIETLCVPRWLLHVRRECRRRNLI